MSEREDRNKIGQKRKDRPFFVEDRNYVKKRKVNSSVMEIEDVNDHEISQGKKKPKLEFNEEEIWLRRWHYGSTLSIYDRQKFENEFDCKNLNLTKDMENVYKNNPHIRQVFANSQTFKKSTKKFRHNDRVLDFLKSPKTPYRRRNGEIKTVEHWGQRKLILSEIEFLSGLGDIEMTVIYAGAAPGIHINYLSELFPKISWILIDPSPFKIKGSKSIQIINDFFTTKMAKKYSKMNDRNCVFISDIRSLSTDKSISTNEMEAVIMKDMTLQETWVRTMQPKYSLLKFRLPYGKGRTTYLKGDIFLPVFGGRTTTESRLFIKRNDSKEFKIFKKYSSFIYDHCTYESMMFHFNVNTRTTYFEHDIIAEGIDHCYDCSAEIFILKKYLKNIIKVPKIYRNIEVSRMSKELSRRISKSGKRNLSMNCIMDFNFNEFTKNIIPIQ